jgi:hypothetical protein
MHTTIMSLVATLRETFLGRASRHLENLALRQQVAILKRDRRRPWLQTLDRLFWVILSRFWPRWREALRQTKRGLRCPKMSVNASVECVGRTHCGALLASTANS